MKSEVPLLIIGDYFHKRGIDGNNLISSLKFQFNNVKILKINESINIESINYLNIKNIVRNKFHTTLTSLFCFNLDDTFSVRQVFSKLKKIFFGLTLTVLLLYQMLNILFHYYLNLKMIELF